MNQALSRVEGDPGVLLTCGVILSFDQDLGIPPSGNREVRTPLKLRWGTRVSS